MARLCFPRTNPSGFLEEHLEQQMFSYGFYMIGGFDDYTRRAAARQLGLLAE